MGLLLCMCAVIVYRDPQSKYTCSGGRAVNYIKIIFHPDPIGGADSVSSCSSLQACAIVAVSGLHTVN